MPPKRVAHKRAISAKDITTVAPKRAKRQVSDARSAGTKPKSTAKSAVQDSDEELDNSGSEDDQDASDFEDVDDEEEEEDVSEAESEEFSDEAPNSKRRISGARSRGAQSTPPSHKKVTSRTVPKSKDLLKPGTKTGLEPGVQVIMKKPKARSAGTTPYTDDSIHPNTLWFLGELGANNNRPWLKTSLKDFSSFIETLSEKVIESDDSIPELPMKDVIIRIHRDVRFSKDQTPYKSHYAAAWSRTGRKGPFAKYYFHIKPGGCTIAAGLWQPEAQALSLMRRTIDRRSNALKKILRDPNIRREFLGGAKDDDKAVVKKFIDHNKESALKTKPKGFESDHKDIDLLRLRSYTVARKLKDEEVLGPSGLKNIATLIGYLLPFVTYLNSIVMPDDEDEDEAEVDEEQDDGEDEDEGEDD